MFEVLVWWTEDYKSYEFSTEEQAREYIYLIPMGLGLDWSLWYVDSAAMMMIGGS